MISRTEWASIHTWLAENYGSADKCELKECTKPATRFHWCLIAGKEYKRNRRNFMQMCAGCHRRYDIAHKDQNHGKYRKTDRQVRLSKESYDIVRKEAYRKHIPMTDVLHTMIRYYTEENIPLSKQ